MYHACGRVQREPRFADAVAPGGDGIKEDDGRLPCRPQVERTHQVNAAFLVIGYGIDYVEGIAARVRRDLRPTASVGGRRQADWRQPALRGCRVTAISPAIQHFAVRAAAPDYMQPLLAVH